jgi:nitrite reductase/ring-hydroxylating ferredoxin subunit
MLSKDDNDLLTRVEGDAPMGAMLKQNYWVPALRAGRLEKDGAPIHVRLFGQDFVAFRASDGRVGFFDEKCPHRGVSLTLARNEDCALRCIFHGMKFHVSGRVVEAPTQSVNPEAFTRTMKLKHYPAREAGGLVWVWLGQGAEPPPLPELEFMGLPPEHLNVRLQTLHCNWMQGVEATIDSSHVGILHKNWVGNLGELNLTADNTAPRYEVEMQPYGMKAAALRGLANGQTYVRVTELVFPYVSYIPPATMHTGDRLAIITVPVDDEHSIQVFVRYNINKPIRHDDWLALADPDAFAPVQGGRHNAWSQDRAAMQQDNFSGFDNLQLEDFVMQTSMGAIADRTQEQLCNGDAVIVRARRVYLQTAKDFRDGKTVAPVIGSAPQLRDVRAWSFLASTPDAPRWAQPELRAAAGVA